ncbi:2-hydroxyacyl-CoA dehydratase family protein [Caulobacter sp. X]|uniref:2-hydroxyacyl-CoA dehydratase family protein n=1 Tax=Caulobacter sp. X TaxID=2048901 RepID=UPI000C152995|nr:2-hydroxyacyl-CoA dehydratase family protein [Caulobacter sp. X]PIC00091.1 2-hydroxyglutaryl-CoA dehydratase [Caulobacter sp. X]
MAGPILACVGADIPRELVAATGFTPFRLAADTTATTAEGLAGQSPRTRALLSQIQTGAFAGVAIAHGCAEDAQLFSVLRELSRVGSLDRPPVAHLDVLYGADPAIDAYNRARLVAFRSWLESLTGKAVTSEALRDEIARANAQRLKLARALALRAEPAPRLGGVQALDLIRALSQVSPQDGDRLIDKALAEARPIAGRRVLITGSPHETSALYGAIEAAGCVIVGEDHDWGEAWASAMLDEALDPLEALIARWRKPSLSAPTGSSRVRALALAARARELDVDAVIHVRLTGDEASPWDVAEARKALEIVGKPLATLRLDPAPNPAAAADIADKLSAFFADPSGSRAPPPSAAKPNAAAEKRPAGASIGRRSHKALTSTADFAAWQRDWFADVRLKAAEGPFAVVNADAPQEILRAMDIPYVVNQWWASIVAAKQRGRDYAALLRATDYPSDVESYSAQGLAAALDADVEDAPWGGLPKPDILALTAGSDAGAKLFEAWSRETGAELLVFARSIEARWDLPIAWWSDLPERWDETLEAERLDLLTAQLEASIPRLEAITGRKFDPARFVEVMNLVNEQEDYYRRTRDLIAATRPAPAGIVDTMPATMVPQWHRGSTWGRDAAKRFYEEVAARVAAGEAACPGERIRLMWVGRGLWSDMGFYQRWEKSHGAVFVWSMYLGLAADGYLRFFDGEKDAMRALAARFVTMGDELRMPTWAGAWHVKEAQTHGVHGAVAIDDADPFVLAALERAGVPVLRLPMGNMSLDGDALEAAVTAFIEGPVASYRDQWHSSSPGEFR